MASHYMIFGGVLEWPLVTFFWTPTISWSRLLACVRSGLETWNLLCVEIIATYDKQMGAHIGKDVMYCELF